MKRIWYFVSLILALIIDMYRFVVSRLRRLVVYNRINIVIPIIADRSNNKENKSKVLAVINHIASSDEVRCGEKGSAKIEKLSKTIEGVVTSLAHCECQIIINTIPL